MDLQALKVGNALFSIGLKEKDFQKVEEELSNDYLGIYVVKKTKKGYLTIDKDRKEIGFWNTSKVLPAGSRIVCRVLCSFKEEIPEEIYRLHILFRRGNREFSQTANSLSQLKDKVLAALVSRKDYTLPIDQVINFCWLFEDTSAFDIKTGRDGFDTIVKVFSKNNTRVAVVYSKDKSEYYWETQESVKSDYYVRTFRPEDPEYNYVSPGREFRYNTWLADEYIGIVKPEELEIIQEKHRGDFVLVDNQSYLDECYAAARARALERRRDRMEQEAHKKTISIFKEKKEIRRGDIIYRPKEIVYNDLVLKAKFLESLIMREDLYLKDMDFNSLLRLFVDQTLGVSYYNNYYDTKEVFCINDIDVVIGKVKAKIRKKSNNVFLNDCRVRTDEIRRVLLTASTFQKQTDFDAFVKNVSKVSLRVMDALEHGISTEISATAGNRRNLESNEGIQYWFNSAKEKGPMHLNLKIEREDNKNYLVFGDKRLKIKHIESIFKIANIGSTTSHIGGVAKSDIERLTTYLFEGVESISVDDVARLVRDGHKAYVAKVKRSLEFINTAVTVTNATKTTLSDKMCYIVEGKSKTKYAVFEDLTVYTIKEGKLDKYLCLADVGSEKTEFGKNDCIAKRLYALKDDVSAAKNIYALGDKVDKHWLEV